MMKLLIIMTFMALPALGASGPGTYGPGLGGDALANTTLGPGGNEVSLRFRAEPGGVLQGIRPFIIWSFRKTGYHGGTGGILKVDVQTDDGSQEHLPSGKVLASSVQRLYIVPASDQFYPLITFDRAPVLTPGVLYHAVFSNPHPQREVNFVSVNAMFSKVADSPRQPTLKDEDWGMLIRNARHPVWAVRQTPGTREGFTPILEVTYDRGSQGVGYMDLWLGAGQPIGGPARVGEVFTVGGPSRRATAVRVRVRRLAGSLPLAIRLETPEGQPIAETTGGEALVTSAAHALGGCAWVTASFKTPVPLVIGRAYRLVLAAPQAASFEAFPLRKGADKGFTPATFFGDGYAEFNDGRGWKGWEQWGQKNRTDSDLQFLFVLDAQ